MSTMYIESFPRNVYIFYNILQRLLLGYFIKFIFHFPTVKHPNPFSGYEIYIRV